MKNSTVIITTGAVVILGAVCLFQTRQLETRKTDLADLQEKVTEQATHLDEIHSSQERLQQQRLDLTDQLEATSSALAAAQHQVTIASSNAAALRASAAADVSQIEPARKRATGLGGAIAKMFDDPDMKKMLVQQQRAVMDMMYGPLFKELGLSNEEADRLKELLLAQQMKGVEQAGALFNNQASKEEKAELARAMGDAAKQTEEEIKALLGDARYAQYTDYRETLGDRMQLNQYSQQLSGGDHALSTEQRDLLLAILKEERAALAADFSSLAATGAQSGNLPDTFSEEKMTQLFDLQQYLGQRVYDRARTVLYPEQLEALGDFQTNQLSMQRLGIKMFQGMRGEGEQAPGDAPQTTL